MTEFLRKRWVLFVVLIVFVICKIPHLHYAYYWDESWPYAVAIKAMYSHGISLMPTAIDGELSRGHPLFFHAAGALWMNIFGESHVSMHSFALLISLLFLLTVFETALKLFDVKAAIISLVFVATQVMFFVQSSFVLFDMLVAFLAFLSIYLYVREKYILTALALTILFYTKESGMIAGFVIGMHALISSFSKLITWRIRISRLASVAVPCILIGVFFIIQKQVRGWYILPMYNNLIEHNWDNFWNNFRFNSLKLTFEMDFRYYYLPGMLALAIVAAVKKRDARYLVLFLPAVIVYYLTDDWRTGRIMPAVPFFIVFILSVPIMLFALVKLKVLESTPQKKFIILLCAFTFCFWVFSAMNFFTPRYLLAAVVPLLVFAGVISARLIDLTYKWLIYPLLLLIVAVGAYSFSTDNNYGDCNLGAFDGLEVQQHVVDFFEQHKYYDKNIGCLFQEHEHLSDAASGFLRSSRVFKNVGWDMNGNTDFAVFDNIEPDSRYEMIKKLPNFHLVYKYQKGIVWAEVYERQ